ncbi:MAG TPA: hypothetical protein VJ112_02445 [Rhabdochlamydiaceae bacterium]|nr:hypothetical protein [Rhabdochlamydiaceae bacterium]
MGEIKGVRTSPLIRQRNWKEKACETLVFRSWWMFLFLALCFLVYSHAMHKKDQAYRELENYLANLKTEKDILLQDRDDLLLQVGSQSDPSWIQLMLMKGLGVVPEGQVKVYFTKEEQ